MATKDTTTSAGVAAATTVLCTSLEHLAEHLAADLELTAALTVGAQAFALKHGRSLDVDDAVDALERLTDLPCTAFKLMRTPGTTERARARAAISSGTGAADLMRSTLHLEPRVG